jgi:hypothetical protein
MSCPSLDTFDNGYQLRDNYVKLLLITIAFILSHILQCSGQQSWRQVIFIELQAKHQSSLGVENDEDDMGSDVSCII